MHCIASGSTVERQGEQTREVGPGAMESRRAARGKTSCASLYWRMGSPEASSLKSFLFRIAESDYDLSRNIRAGREVAWRVSSHLRLLRRGATVYLWMDAAVKRTGLYARARIVSDGVYVDRAGACRVGLRFEVRFATLVTLPALRSLLSRRKRAVVEMPPQLIAEIEREVICG